MFFRNNFFKIGGISQYKLIGPIFNSYGMWVFPKIPHIFLIKPSSAFCWTYYELVEISVIIMENSILN